MSYKAQNKMTSVSYQVYDSGGMSVVVVAQ